MAMMMWMEAAYQRTHSPSRLAWFEGWRPPGHQSAITNYQMNWVNFCNGAMASPWLSLVLLLLISNEQKFLIVIRIS